MAEREPWEDELVEGLVKAGHDNFSAADSEEAMENIAEPIAKAIKQGGSSGQQQSDWNETDPSKVTFIKNKPNLPSDIPSRQEMNAAIGVETTRATAAEASLQTQINGKASQSALEAESARAQNAESALGTRLTTAESDIDALQQGLADEIEDRGEADRDLQSQIDAISSRSDVVDVVASYAELLAYDTSELGDNDVIKVLEDETQENAISYYRFHLVTDTWSLIGTQGPYYTMSEIDSMLADKQDLLATSATTSSWNDNTPIVTGFTSPNLITRTALSLYNWVKGKLDSVYSAISHTHSVKINGNTKTIAASGGTAVDLGTYLTTHQDISGKADKVSGATNGHFAGLNSSGNLIDSGKKASDFATAAQGTKADTALQSADLSGYHKDYSYCKRIVLNIPANNGVIIRFDAPSSGQRFVQFFIRYGKVSSVVELNVGMIVSTTAVTSCTASILVNVSLASTNNPTDVHYNFDGKAGLFFRDTNASNPKVVEIIAMSNADVDYTTQFYDDATDWPKVSLRAFPRIDLDTLLSGGGIGSTTQPVFVDGTGMVQPCKDSVLYLTKTANYALTASELQNNVIVNRSAITGNSKYMDFYNDRMIEGVKYTFISINSDNTSSYKMRPRAHFTTAGALYGMNRTTNGVAGESVEITMGGSSSVMLIRIGSDFYQFGY